MITHFVDTSIALANTFSANNGDDAIKHYELNANADAVAKVNSLMPANNLNFSIIGAALGTVKSE